LADATIKSPISGFINERYVEVGAYLNPGARLFDIIDDSQLKLKCSLTESQVEA
jgi:multidrug resistance efflux pump